MDEVRNAVNNAIKKNWNVKCEEVGILHGGKWDKLQDISRRVYGTDGVAPTVHTCGGGNQELKIAEPQGIRMVRTEEGKALRKAYEAGEIKHGFNEHRKGEIRTDGILGTVTTVEKDCYIAEPKGCAIRTRAYDGKEAQIEMGGDVANSITTVEKDSMVCETQIRVRKITERESFRLMGVKDEDFERVARNQSNSSLRHLAGDSIVVDVLMAIFGGML